MGKYDIDDKFIIRITDTVGESKEWYRINNTNILIPEYILNTCTKDEQPLNIYDYGYKKGYDDGYVNGQKDEMNVDINDFHQTWKRAHAIGFSNCWSLISDLHAHLQDLPEIFGCSKMNILESIDWIFKHFDFDYAEIQNKIEEWKIQQEENKLKVNDEVILIGPTPPIKGVVTCIFKNANNNDQYSILFENGNSMKCEEDVLKKTGKMIDIQSILSQMENPLEKE